MITAIDTNILVDVLEASVRALEDAATSESHTLLVAA
jgi:hypothetical protein